MGCAMVIDIKQANHAKPKVLVVGNWVHDFYEQAFYDGFCALGVRAVKFAWRDYFFGYPTHGVLSNDGHWLRSLYYRLQNKFLFGPALHKLNKGLIACCAKEQPDVLFISRGTHIFPNTIEKVKRETGALVFSFNNDDPFSTKMPRYLWRHYKKSVAKSDYIFCYRQKNKMDYAGVGLYNVEVLLPYYIKSRNFPIPEAQTTPYACDVIFIGHYENDGRDEYLVALLEAGVSLKLYGQGWKHSRHYAYFKQKLGQIKSLFNDYNQAINSAKIALVFLSKLNSDQYTRRCFEIPATKIMMLSEHSAKLKTFFAADKEAVYFRSIPELLDKVRFYLAHPAIRKKIAEAGHRRLVSGKHEAVDRCAQVLDKYFELKPLLALDQVKNSKVNQLDEVLQ